MVIKAYKLNSFTKCIDGGNPAGVVLGAEVLKEEQMQKLAETIGFSETAFIAASPMADFQVRFFTPNAEVELCGHATIAAFSLLKYKRLIQEGHYAQATKAGILKIMAEGNSIYMQQTAPQFYETISREEVISCLGIKKEDFDERLPIQIVSTGLKDILVPVKNEPLLEGLVPDMDRIEQISARHNVVGLHVFTIRNDRNMTALCRNFAPLYGIPEESATGTSNGALACYLYKYGFLSANSEAIFEQGMYMNKPSYIKARLAVRDDSLKEIWIGGEAVLLGENNYQI